MTQPLRLRSMGYTQTCKDGVLSPPSGKQLRLFYAKAVNNSAGSIDVGLGVKLADADIQLYTLTAASTPDALDVTSTIQAGTAVNIFTTTANGGYLVSAPRQFGIFGFTVSQAESGSPVYTYQYYDGSTYQTLTTISVPSTYGTGTNLVVFAPPQDWAPGTTVAVGGSSTNYNIRVLSTTAGGQAVKATAFWVVDVLGYSLGLADKGSLEIDMTATEGVLLSGQEQLVPYFGTASGKNSVVMAYKNIG